MDKGDEPAMGTDTRVLVDELQAPGLEAAQLLFQIAHFQGHMMHALAARLQKSRDARSFGNGHQQFEVAGSGRERGDSHALIVEIRLDRLVEPKQTVMRDSLIKVANDDANVM